METNIEKIFDILYENNSSKNYIVLRSTDKSKLVDYQVQMLINNRIKGLLEFNINFIREDINCFYNITSKCSLASFTARKRFTRDEFLTMLFSIVNNIYYLKNYLLYDSNILLDERYIYVEPESLSIHFVYLPFSKCKNDYKAFFTKLIVDLVKFNEEESDNYLQKILEVVKDELFSLTALNYLLKSLLGKNSEKNVPARNIEERRELSTEKPERENYNTRSDVQNLKIPNPFTHKNGSLRTPPLVNKKENLHKIKTEKIKNEDSKIFVNNNSKLINKSKLLILLLQPVLIFSFILLCNVSLVSSAENRIMTVGILLIIILLFDILVVRLIKQKMKSEPDKNNTDILSVISAKMKGTGSMDNSETNCNKLGPSQVKESTLTHIASAALKPKVTVLDTKTNKYDIASSVSHYSGETEIIIKPKHKTLPYLKSNNGQEHLELNKKSILIGRIDNYVDYILDSSAVGKIHAELILESNEYYVMDCNSKNGTYVNNNRITPNIKNKLSNNDVIRFANKEFVFCSGKYQQEGTLC